jgi:hypothetical protein
MPFAEVVKNVNAVKSNGGKPKSVWTPICLHYRSQMKSDIDILQESRVVFRLTSSFSQVFAVGNVLNGFLDQAVF